MIRWILLLFPLTLFAGTEIPITIEHATTEKQIRTGLMHRDHLPKNHGMLFHYDKPGVYRFWMLNCLIPLSIAFMDENGVILSVKDLDAHPEHYNKDVILNDLDIYDPGIKVFFKESVLSPIGTQYVLEMEGGWYQKAGVKVGDRLVWLYPSPRAKVMLRK